MANFLRLPSVGFPVLLKTVLRPNVSLPRLKPLKFDVLGERHGCAQVVRRDARYLSSTSDANNGANKSSCDEETVKGCGGNEDKPNGVMDKKVTSRSSLECHVRAFKQASDNLLSSIIREVNHIRFHRMLPRSDHEYVVYSLTSGQGDALLRVKTEKLYFGEAKNQTHPPANMQLGESKIVPGDILVYKLLIKDTIANKDYNLGWNLADEPELKEVEGNENYYFDVMYGWSYTMFKQHKESGRYLASGKDGRATFVEMKNPNYPDPQTLFILNDRS